MKSNGYILHLNDEKKVPVTFKRNRTTASIKEKTSQTTNFKYAVGVFEGGGVKGAAYAGALDACEEGGITFVGACGTSAGSIAAALVAAGATTNQIEKALSVNFSTFVTPGKTIIGFRRWIKKTLQKHNLRAVEKTLLKIRIFISRIGFEKGISHSDEIHNWLNATLCEILNLKPGTTVKFSDLRKPLAVLATDISNNQAKIWTSEDTPDASVAYAVRCSCSIPLFFYPIENEDSSYIDGGAIANLPLFLAKKLSDVTFVPIICFQFEKSNNYTSINNLSYIEFIYRIIGTTIKSNTDMQLHLNEEWHNVTIENCGIGSTEFFLSEQEKSALINAGRSSVSTFIKTETLANHKDRESNKESNDTNRHYHLNETQRLISEATKEICFFAGDLSWLKDLFMALAAAKLRRKIQINILIDKEKFSEQETIKNIRFATSLGISVKCSKGRIHIRGLIVDRNENHGTGIFIENSEFPYNQRITKDDYPRFFSHVNELFEQNWPTNQSENQGCSISIQPIRHGKIIDQLKKIKQYKDAHISFVKLQTSQLIPLSNNAELFKLERIVHLTELQSAADNAQSFQIMGTEWIFIPPIVELHSDSYVVIDGTHRCYLAANKKQEMMDVILIKGCKAILPANPGSSWREIRVSTKKREIAKNYTNYVKKEFRHIKAQMIDLAKVRNKTMR